MNHGSPSKAEKVTFSFHESDGQIDETEEISWDSLPKGKYFFHATTIQRLDSIKQIGLVPPNSHTLGRYWDKLLRDARKDRLFLFTSEDDCFFWIRAEQLMNPETIFTVLRFERFLIDGFKLFADPLLHPEHEISFSASCKIPPQNLEACERANHDNRCLEWVPILTRLPRIYVRKAGLEP